MIHWPHADAVNRPLRHSSTSGTMSFTTNSGLHRKRKRGAWPRSMPMPRETSSLAPLGNYARLRAKSVRSRMRQRQLSKAQTPGPRTAWRTASAASEARILREEASGQCVRKGRRIASERRRRCQPRTEAARRCWARSSVVWSPNTATTESVEGADCVAGAS